MNPARLRALIRRYGEFGVLLVACYLGLHHLWTKRRLMLVTCILSTMLAGMLLWSQPQSAPIYPDFTQRMQPVSPPVTGQCDCSSETYQEEPAPAPFSPFAPLDIKVSSSRMPQGRYAVTMRDANGTEFQVRIFSAHEKVEIDNDAGSEFGGAERNTIPDPIRSLCAV